MAQVDAPHPLGYPTNDLDPHAMEEFAARLEDIDRQDLVEILNSVPSSWPVTDEELEALGYFLERRAPAVADRVRQLQQT